jgi:arginyl-tRNA synthetase
MHGELLLHAFLYQARSEEKAMKKILDTLSDLVGQAFAENGYEASLGRVTLSNRPDLCEFQCNGAMAGAKLYHKAPIMIANAVTETLKQQIDSETGCAIWEEVSAVNPGFINLKLHTEFLRSVLIQMNQEEKLGCQVEETPKTIVIDYGGPNVAKPLHIGHLRSAIIGESIKRICRYMGNQVIGDVHLGDWGLQMGLIMQEVKERQPELPYFDPDFTGEYPKEAPFTISELEEIYPFASAKSKEDEEYSKKAHDTTFRFQQGDPGLVALWKHIIQVSVSDLKENYKKLNVDFDVWYGESDAQPFIPAMVEKMKTEGFAYESQGALIVDVAEESDTKEVPPCILVKSDGATLYSTTDLATIVQRVQEYNPDAIIYLTDKRQEMHFTQVFRCSRKTGLVDEHVRLTHIGFGTMNGKDGKPFKTRSGGVMRLEYLIQEIENAVYDRIMENRTMEDDEARKTAAIVGLAALKYGDLSNQASKDYIFDIDRFASFEGNTGPYILYTIVRIKSILTKYTQSGGELPASAQILPGTSESEKRLQLCLAQFPEIMDLAYRELAPHKICQYIYELANTFNQFYHDTKILTEQDEEKKAGYICLITLTRKVLEASIDVLGFSAPDRM